MLISFVVNKCWSAQNKLFWLLQYWLSALLLPWCRLPDQQQSSAVLNYKGIVRGENTASMWSNNLYNPQGSQQIWWNSLRLKILQFILNKLITWNKKDLLSLKQSDRKYLNLSTSCYSIYIEQISLLEIWNPDQLKTLIVLLYTIWINSLDPLEKIKICRKNKR